MFLNFFTTSDVFDFTHNLPDNLLPIPLPPLKVKILKFLAPVQIIQLEILLLHPCYESIPNSFVPNFKNSGSDSGEIFDSGRCLITIVKFLIFEVRAFNR